MLVVLVDATQVCAGPQSWEGGHPPQVPWQPSLPQVFPVQLAAQAPPEDELVELLRSGAEIEGYCSSCDAHWSISIEERADLARALSRL